MSRAETTWYNDAIPYAPASAPGRSASHALRAPSPAQAAAKEAPVPWGFESKPATPRGAGR